MIRVVFFYSGYCRITKKRTRPDRWWVFFGERLETKFNRKHETDCLYLDGKLLAVPAAEGFTLAGKWSVKAMWVDSLAYTLEGRAWVDSPAKGGVDDVTAPCIFCGKTEKHINGGGNAWFCGHVDAKDVVTYHLYCNTVQCNNEHVWQCRNCAVDVVGDRCHECKGKRAEVARGPDDD